MRPSQMVSSGKCELAVYQWNAAAIDKPPLLFVHGYPDNAETWIPLIRLLQDHFRIAAYDVRGAGFSSKPFWTRDYQIPFLMQDLEAVINAVSPDEPIHLIGHDWGSIQSWHGVCSPELGKRIASYTSISGPCLDHVGFWLRHRLSSYERDRVQTVLRQLQHSWYMGLYQIPGLAPLVWHTGLGSRLLKLLDRSHIETGAQLETDSSIGSRLYRANVLPHLLKPQELRTDTPVLLIIPTQDPFATPSLYEELDQWVPNLKRKSIAAQHWVQQSHPEWLADQIRAFVRASNAAI